MRILFVTAGAQVSISDVSRGYQNAFERQGCHEIVYYDMMRRLSYHSGALPDEMRSDVGVLMRQASENIPLEALYHEAELVVIPSGLNIHPVVLWTLAQLGIPTAVIFTESPYDDGPQKLWADLSLVGTQSNATLFTNDRESSDRMGWHYLPPAYDPAIHRPVPAVEDKQCDVVLVATGWKDRVSFLEAVDWNGIDLQIFGVWDVPVDSPLHKYVHPLVISNDNIAETYCSAKVCLNFHRRSPEAYTPNPRTYEIAACGAFQLSDPRPGLMEMFGSNIPTFSSPESLGEMVQYYLAHPDEMAFKASAARRLVTEETFDVRAKRLVEVMEPQVTAYAAVKPRKPVVPDTVGIHYVDTSQQQQQQEPVVDAT